MKSRIKFREEKPKVIISKCLNFDKCRYNGEGDNDKFVEKLKEFVDFIPVCPEIEIGLSTPRDVIRLVEFDEEVKLLQPKTKKEFTTNMYEFGADFLEGLQEVDGFILKNRSPSCGIKDVKIYSSSEKGAASRKGSGIFGGLVKEYFPNLVVEDDGRLKNYSIREHFLTKLYLLYDFRKIKEKKSLEELRKFHSENKLLLMAYNQTQLKNLGQVIGNSQNLDKDQILYQYEQYLSMALSKAPRYTSNINVLMRCMGYFSNKITHEEKEFILQTIQKYRDGKVPFSVPLHVIKSYVVRFNEKNLINQSFFEPYPIDLIDVTDSGKGR